MSIKSLDTHTAELLRSQVNILSFEDCVSEVVQNSLDAGASIVDVDVDLTKLAFTVKDNGVGIDPASLERVGSLHNTSKISSLDELGEIKTYGFRGEALASIANMSLLTITTKHKDFGRASVLRVYNGRRVASFEPHNDPSSSGTIVSVANLYANMPVRRRFSKVDISKVKRTLAPTLVTSKAKLTLYDKGTKCFSTSIRKEGDDLMDRAATILHDMGLAVDASTSWSHFSENSGSIELKGIVSRSSSKNSIQLLIVNDRLVDDPKFYTNARSYLRALKLHGPANPTATQSTSFLVIVKCRLNGSLLLENPQKTLSNAAGVLQDATRITLKAFEDMASNSKTDNVSRKRKSCEDQLGAVTKVRSSNESSREVQSRLDFKVTKKPHRADICCKQVEARPTNGFDVSKFFTPGYKSNIQIDKKVHRDALSDPRCRVINQIRDAFIMIRLPTINDGTILALMDQHAADERIRVERILENLCYEPSPRLLQIPISVMPFSEECVRSFRQWGLLFDENRRLLTHVPQIALSKCSQDTEYAQALVTEFVHLIESKHISARVLSPHWHVAVRNCPPKLLDIANSAACRGAIMFGDSLTHDQCTKLIGDLAACRIPFQCAHGRPSIIPLMNL